ncbi:S8 family serine peptidase [Streptomyces alkaliphilus]|uniref:S8 family serine peptidase n=1 Tax=Streptomyces alkaliphilus TaxID=1472722 RepID=A0A7W3TAT1_9ACTN|nr:S8 family serine peptidase [Streptomyces alkaliphilus]MBB0243135.1 S8 family serine peptidase [Streptomyces alkaliphilus]
MPDAHRPHAEHHPHPIPTPPTPGRRRSRAIRSGLLAAALAGALTGTLLGGPASAAPPDGPAGPAGPTGNGTFAGESPAPRTLTLITGDRVRLNPDGSVAGILPAEGREDIPVHVLQGGDGTLVLPHDVTDAIADGTLDRRLFDTAELTRPEYEEIDGLPVIVLYEEDGEGGAEAREALHAEVDTDAPVELDSIDAEALTLAEEETAPAWEALTVEADTTARSKTPLLDGASLAPGVRALVLDGVVEATLNSSPARIGAPAARELGLDGEGVTVAILDTGIDATHPDLADRVVKQVNFSDAPEIGDVAGHGTHVGSTVAGTGAASDGLYTGVAPGADILDVKVLNDWGSGLESGVIAGMEWAVEQNADIVNMSLGYFVTDAVHSVEEALERLSAQSDTLFVIAAGNEGPFTASLRAPATAEAALTVGALDWDDTVADFSSSGPRFRDGLPKPDLTAPGVEITAAAAGTGGYVAMGGTSMASPHVAGAAALLAQARPELTPEELKAVLVGSAVGLADTPVHRQGTGRIDIPRALAADVIAEPVSLGFGLIPWGSGETDPITRELTYRNLGTEDITLRLSLDALTPDGSPAPEGMFALAADEVTVPAGGTASVEVTADPGLGEEGAGVYGTAVIATDGEREVRTAGSLYMELRMSTVRVEHLDRAGEPTENWTTKAFNPITGEERFFEPDPDEGSHVGRLRLTEGNWTIDTRIWQTEENELTWMLHPWLEVGEKFEDIRLTHSSAEARPVRMTLHDRRAEHQGLNIGFEVESEEFWVERSLVLPDGISLRTAQIGNYPAEFEVVGGAMATWETPDGTRRYHAATVDPEGLPSGVTQHTTARDLARITTRVGIWAPGREVSLHTSPREMPLISYDSFYDSPAEVDVYIRPDDLIWYQSAIQWSPTSWDFESLHVATYPDLRPGSSRTETFNVGVFGPAPEDIGFVRTEDTIRVALWPLTDGAGHRGVAYDATGETVLYRDGEEVSRVPEAPDFATPDVPAGEGDYRLETVTDRTDTAAPISTRVETAHTFRSATPPEGEETQLPISAVRYQPDLALDSTAKAGKKIKVPLTVVGAAAGKNTETLRIEVSLDGGNTWKTAKVTGKATDKKDNRSFTVHNPAAGGSVSLRAHLTDTNGNTTEQTIIDAWRTR